MRVNITAGYVPMQEFLELLDTTTNLKDVHLLVHQAGCPVYVLRDTDDNCYLFWHPCKDAAKNTLNMNINDGILEVLYEGEVQAFETLESMRNEMLANHMLGDTPFDDKYLVWAKNTPSLLDTMQICGS